MIKKLIKKLFNKKSPAKIGGHDLDDKGTPKEEKPIIWMTPTTSANSTPKDIKITPADSKDIAPKAKTAAPARKPGRPKGQTSKGHSTGKPTKKVAPKNNPNKK
jgi:hypothetical protein